jgi:hypothetical protein
MKGTEEERGKGQRDNERDGQTERKKKCVCVSLLMGERCG